MRYRDRQKLGIWTECRHPRIRHDNGHLRAGDSFDDSDLLTSKKILPGGDAIKWPPCQRNAAIGWSESSFRLPNKEQLLHYSCCLESLHQIINDIPSLTSNDIPLYHSIVQDFLSALWLSSLPLSPLLRPCTCGILPFWTIVTDDMSFAKAEDNSTFHDLIFPCTYSRRSPRGLCARA